MIIHEYNLVDFERMVGLPKGYLNFDGVIVDNETGNDLLSVNWRYDKADVIVAGFLYDDKIVILMKTEKDDDEFLQNVKARLDSFKKSREMFAYNVDMERGNYEGLFGVTYPFKEIKPFETKKGKEWLYLQLIKHNVANLKKDIEDPFAGNSIQCVNVWKEYLRSGVHNILYDVIKHNVACLIKERLIYKHKEHFENLELYPLIDGVLDKETKVKKQ